MDRALARFIGDVFDIVADNLLPVSYTHLTLPTKWIV